MADDNKDDKKTTPKTEEHDDPLASGGRLAPDRLKAEHGSTEAALRALAYKLNDVERDNKRYRDEIKDLKAKVPGGDSVVLAGDELKEYQGFKALGSLDDVSKKLKAGEEATAKIASFERDAHLRSIAEAAGVNYDVLKIAPGASDLTFEVKGEGDEKKVTVTHKNGEDKEVVTDFKAYADEHWRPIAASLFVAEQQAPVQRYIHQAPGGRQGGGEVSEKDVDADQSVRIGGLGL